MLGNSIIRGDMILVLLLRILNSRIEVTIGHLRQLLIMHMNLLLLLRVGRMHGLPISTSAEWYLRCFREHHCCLCRR